MTESQLEKARKLKQQKKKVLGELGIWEKSLTKKTDLGYLQSWDKGRLAKLETSISDGIFDGFRCAAMDNLKLMLVKIDADFAEI